jgi:hypothetical protein
MSAAGERVMMGVLAAFSGLLFGTSAYLRGRYATPAGDEPHYLVFNTALQKYGTLDITPVYANKDYWQYYPAVLQPHLAVTSQGPIPLHGFGGPLLWHGAYLAAGRAGVLAFMAAVSTLVIVNLYRLLREVRITRGYAGFTAALCAAGSPFYVFSGMGFVEPLGALAVVYAARMAFQKKPRNGQLALAGIGLGAIPWIHPRFILLSACLGAILLWRIWRDPKLYRTRATLAFTLPLAALGGGFQLYNVLKWHTLDPAPGISAYGERLLLSSTWHGLAGLLVDGHFGLLVAFPLFVLMLPGALLLLRRKSMSMTLAMAVVPYFLAIGSFSTWWAGYSPPARFLTAIVPILATYVAHALQGIHSRWLDTLAALAALLSLGRGIETDLVWQLRFINEPMNDRRLYAFTAAVMLVAGLAVWRAGRRRIRRIRA